MCEMAVFLSLDGKHLAVNESKIRQNLLGEKLRRRRNEISDILERYYKIGSRLY